MAASAWRAISVRKLAQGGMGHPVIGANRPSVEVLYGCEHFQAAGVSLEQALGRACREEEPEWPALAVEPAAVPE